jgi:hypothetical protein
MYPSLPSHVVLAHLGPLPRSALLLQLPVVVVAGVGARDVVAIPRAMLDIGVLRWRDLQFSWIVVPEGVTKGETETCGRLVHPSNFPHTVQNQKDRNQPTQRNAEIGDQPPAEHLKSGQLLFAQLVASSSVGGRYAVNWAPLDRQKGGDSTYASDGCDGHFFRGLCSQRGERRGSRAWVVRCLTTFRTGASR